MIVVNKSNFSVSTVKKLYGSAYAPKNTFYADFKICLALEGEAVWEIEERSHLIQPGDIVFLKIGQARHFTSFGKNGFKLCAFILTRNAFSGLHHFMYFLECIKRQENVIRNSSLSSILRDIYEEWEQNSHLRYELASAKLTEFFIKAERPIPDYDYYEQFYQLENGVGMVRLFSDELDEELEKAKKLRYKKGVLVKGKLFYPILKEKIEKINKKFGGALEVKEIRNDFFGENITVTGLICGCDIIAQVEKGKTPIFIPDAMLKADEEVFLDDVTLKELRKKLGRKIIKTGCSGKMIAETLFR